MTAVPLWTERVLTPKGGQDHLGVGSVVTDRILPALSPGINVLTPHPRYWAFYAFIVDEYWRSKPGSVSRKGLLRYLSRHESIFSIAGHLCDNSEHRASQFPVGSRRVGPLVAEAPKSYRADFPYVKSLGGGYRLYYATVMQTTGVVQLADPSLSLPADAVTPDAGLALADAFRTAVSGTKYYKRYFDADVIPADVVREYAEAACLCRLRESAPDRALVADAFLHGGAAPDAAARRLTLQMMLEIAHQTRKVAIRDEDFRRLVLYGTTWDENDANVIATFHVPSHLTSVVRRWRLSQLREMFNFALNGMWALLVDWGLEAGGDYAPLPMSRVSGLIDRTSFADVPGVSAKTTTKVATLVDQIQTGADVTDSLDGHWDLSLALTEDALLNTLWSTDLDRESRLGVLFSLYTLCLARLWDPELAAAVPSQDWAPVIEGRNLRVGMDGALRQLRLDAQTGKTVRDSLERVLTNHVISQHERVAVTKLPEDTFRFRRESDRIRFFSQGTGFSRNDSRFGALSATCAELNWSGYFSEARHGLTPDGAQIRAHGDLPVATVQP